MKKNNLPLAATRCGNTEFRWGERTYIIGIINMSPDSFSGDGLGSDIEAASKQAERFITDGADTIDIGGESTRPGSQPVTLDEEIKRVIPAIERLVAEISLPISIDTSNQCDKPCRRDIMADVISDLERSIALAEKAGVNPQNIIIDPGIGFGKSLEQNLEIIRRLAELKSLGKPILLGTSRKSMIGLVLDLPPDQRLEGTAATVAIGIANGADIIRVHDVRQMARVCRMSDAIIRRGLNEC